MRRRPASGVGTIAATHRTAVLKFLLEHKLIDGTTMTVTGKTLAENLEKAQSLPADQDIIRPLDNPIKPSGHIRCACHFISNGS